ncbi:MAG: VWA domain-containing protein [Pyrinomonadaceae bacterium]
MYRGFFLSSPILCLLLVPVSGQQPQPAPSPTPQEATIAPQQKPPSIDQQDVVRINTNLVQVDAVVAKDGKQVTDLKAEDFEIFQDGRRQTITNFSYISNVPSTLPPVVAGGAGRNKKNTPLSSPPVPPAVIKYHDERRTVALMVDDLGLSFESIARVRKQIGKFLDELAPRDLVAIIRTGGEVGALQQFTNDKRLLQSAVDHLRWNPCSRVGINVLAPERPEGDEIGRPQCSNGTNMGSTLGTTKFVLEGMRDLPGRKSMIMFSDNLPIEQQEPQPMNLRSQRENPNDRVNGSVVNPLISFRADLGRVAELAIRASVVIYSVDTQGLQTTGITAADEISSPRPNTPPDQDPYLLLIRKRSLALRIASEGSELIAKQTGGFLIRNSNDYGIQRVMEDQQGYYLIGFRPSEDTFDRKFHHIKAKVKGSGLSVRTRAGFYGFTNEQTRPPEPTVKDQINRALISPFGANEITMHLTTIFVDESSQGSLLRSFLYFDPRDLTFTEEADGWRVATFKLRGFLFGDNGKVIGDQLSKAGTLRLRGPAYDRALREGIVYGFDIPVKQPGAFQFRVALRDGGSSRIGTAGEFVEIPDLHSGRMSLSGIVVRDAAYLPQDGSDAAVRRSSPNAAPEASAGPAVRRFRQGADLIFAYAVYNARLDEAMHLPQLSTQTRVFRDGRPIFTGVTTRLDSAGQSDLQRIASASRLQLGAALLPGDYVLQIIVTDSLAKEKQRTAAQWIDFEVIK